MVNGLNKRQNLFVAVHAGCDIEAARLAGYSDAPKNAHKVANHPIVKKALLEKQRGFLQALGKKQAQGVSITRNDIVNRLDKLSKTAESESAKVGALLGLAKIFGMIISKTEDVTKKFAGWTDEEMEEYATTGIYPERIRSLLGQGGMSGSADESAAI